MSNLIINNKSEGLLLRSMKILWYCSYVWTVSFLFTFFVGYWVLFKIGEEANLVVEPVKWTILCSVISLILMALYLLFADIIRRFCLRVMWFPKSKLNSLNKDHFVGIDGQTGNSVCMFDPSDPKQSSTYRPFIDLNNPSDAALLGLFGFPSKKRWPS